MITVQSWSPSVAVGAVGVVTFSVASERPVVRLEVDPLGDGRVAPTIVRGDDLRAVLALAFVPEVAGTFSLQVRAFDDVGCSDATGVRREVVVQ